MLDFISPTVREPAVAEAALEGLTRSIKTLPPKLFYDAEGCRLFGEITRLPEYYVTRTERALLGAVASEAASSMPPNAALVEYGASSEDKALVLLSAMRAPRAYVPIDVAGEALRDLSERMAPSDVEVFTIEADFLRTIELPAPIERMPKVGFFPGSTIGNLEPETARGFLGTVRSTLGPGSQFLVGVDLRKDPTILIPAYDDAAGVTAAFNRNLLVRLNREAAADFQPDQFAHEARWNADEGRIEMHLVSLRDQVARVGGVEIAFAAGETIHTENSYKHTPAEFRELASGAGWSPDRMWTDPEGKFALFLLRAESLS